MATTNPRITVTLTPAVSAVLKELSSLNGESQSAIVGGLMEMSLPVFERVVAGLRAAATIEESARAEVVAGLDRAQAKLEKQLGLMLGEMDEVARPLLDAAEKVNRRGGGARKRASKALVTPVPLTGGSGPLKRGKSKAVRGS